jgi:ATP:ADP antiporter, AAA family
MKERLFKLLNIEPEEESMVSMLLTQSVFLGIFFGSFDISAHSLFLSVFDEKAMARAYVISGLAGIILTSIYTFFQARLKFRIFASANLLLVTIITFILWLSLLLIPGKIVTFAVFVMLGPLNILAVLGFWGTTGRLFTLRQGKRLFGLVDAGLIIGIIISCYAIPVLLSLGLKSHNILLASTIGVLGGLVIQLVIGRKFTFVATEAPGTGKERKSGFNVFRKDPYIRIMGTFVALSVMTAFFVQYSFMAVTRIQYPLEEDMARFLGLFTGSMMIFTLLIKLLLFSYLIRNYGLKICLALSPLLVAGFTLLAVVTGLTNGFASNASSSFMIFFLILAMSRLFSKSLKDSIESPAFKVIYQTVDEKVRYEVQSGIDGTVNEISALSSGLFLAGLGALSFVRLIHFSWVLFFIISAWIFFAFRLYNEYRNSIKKSLGEAGASTEGDVKEGWETLKSPVAGAAILRNNYYALARGDLSSIDNCTNKWFLERLIGEAGTNQDLNLKPALKRIASGNDVEETIRYRAVEVLDQLEETKGNPNILQGKPGTAHQDDRIINARKSLSGTRVPQTTEILRLLRDNNLEAKRYAVYMIGKFGLYDMIPEVCNSLGIAGLENDSLLVLESFGPKAFDDLFRLYLGSSGNIGISKSIINLLGRSAGKENTDFLFARLWSYSRRIRELAAKSLVTIGYRAAGEEKDRIQQLVSEVIGMLTWNIAAQASLGKTEQKTLAEVIRKETNAWSGFLFDILSIAYDKTYIEKIKANIESGTAGSINYALEMIDIVVDESIKPKVISFLDVVPDEDKLKNLQQFYPGKIVDYYELADDIINRDYNLISLWAKAVALNSLDKINFESLKESVIALLFSPEKILREEAARLIKRSGRHIYDEVASRMKAEDSQVFEDIFSGKSNDASFLFEKVTFLSSFFSNIPEDELIYLAEFMISVNHSGLDIVKTDTSYLIWQMIGINGNPRLNGIMLNGKMEMGEVTDKMEPRGYYLLPLSALDQFRNLYPERLFDVFYQIDKSLNNILTYK